MTASNRQGRTAVIVLGMHRSGTSVLTKTLETLGVFLGDRLMPGKEDNPTGFFEDLDIAAVNLDLLAELGCRWDSILIRNWQELPQERQTHYMEMGSQVIQDRFGDYPLWGFKDPRVTRLLPFWETILGEAGFRILRVVAIRHPLSVVDSLVTRDRMAVGQALILWLLHQVDILSSLLRDGGVVVDYDLLMENPLREAERVGEFLGLQDIQASVSGSLMDFLDTSLRHSQYEPNLDRLPSGWLPETCLQVYRHLQTWASLTGGRTPETLAAEADSLLLSLRRQLAIQQDLLAAWDSALKKEWQLERDLDTAFGKIHATQVELNTTHGELHKAYAKIHGALSDLSDARGELDYWREQLWAERCYWAHQAELNRREAEELRRRLCTVEQKLWHRALNSI